MAKHKFFIVWETEYNTCSGPFITKKAAFEHARLEASSAPGLSYIVLRSVAGYVAEQPVVTEIPADKLLAAATPVELPF